MSRLGPSTRFLAALAIAAAIAAALVAASPLDAGEPQVKPAAREAQATDPYSGIPQDGAVLGRPNAPVTVVEYADLQCPYCAEWAARTLPVLVHDYVRTGKVRLVFRGLAFLGPDSDTALRAALAAGKEQRLWNVVHDLYARQGPENSGWVDEGLLDELGAGDLDRAAPWIDARIERDASAARAAGVSGTPAFQVGRTGGRLELVAMSSLEPEGTLPAVDAALGR